jgi:hypothetical protein
MITSMKYAIIILLMPLCGYSQIKVSLAAGYGTYRMGGLKDILSSINSYLPVNAETASNFPGDFNFETAFNYTSKRGFYSGLTFGYGSTRGRLSYTDQSGSIDIDMPAKFAAFQFSVGLSKKLKNNLIFIADLRPGLDLTSVQIKGSSTLSNQPDTYEDNYGGLNMHVQPTLSLSRRINHFGIKCYAGYYVAFVQSVLVDSKNDDHYLQTPEGDDVYADWSGVRLGIGLEYYFGKP